MSDSGVGTFGSFIALGRKAKNWTQQDLADNSGVARITISRWELNKLDRSPDPRAVRKVCAALDLDPRRAAVLLGYLDEAEITAPAALPPDLEQIFGMIRDLGEADIAERDRLVDYLRYRLDILRREAG